MNPDSPRYLHLKKLAERNAGHTINALLHSPDRLQSLVFSQRHLHLDLSKNLIDNEALQALVDLAEDAGLPDRINDLFAGKVVNPSEQRAALHVQIRDPKAPLYRASLEPMTALVSGYREGALKTAFGQHVTDVVNIGIGGSYLGPRLAVEALTNLQTDNRIKNHFLASVDRAALQQLLQNIDLRHTLFCVSSKSFGTAETLLNARRIAEMLARQPDHAPGPGRCSLVAVTAAHEKASVLDIPDSHVVRMDAAIGGRFSVWSGIGFPLMMAIGPDAFKQFLAGAHSMDAHFHSAPLARNLPVLMALLSIWYRNFIGWPAYAVIPYDARLAQLPSWLQQLMMESTGKQHSLQGTPVHHATAAWVFGGHGQLSQHAFFQAFHQGLDALPIDFIGVLEDDESQQFMLINMLAQGAALMQGRHSAEQTERNTAGNKPSTTLLLDGLHPESLGELLAMYEHMVYCQSVIWEVNCFDQPGVELGKHIALSIQQRMRDGELDALDLDPSTRALLEKVLKHD